MHEPEDPPARAYSKATEMWFCRATLRARYRASIDAYHRATSPDVRAHLAAQAAVAISELQHPDLQDLDGPPTR